jgi:uroporphyrinogen decarboxylase
VIFDRESFEKYPWPDPEKGDFEFLNDIKPEIPDGLKLVVSGPGGVLENVIKLVGYDNLCLLSIDDEELTAEIFEAVGSRLARYYEICAGYDSVGALISNDDWGFKTQPMLSPEAFRKFIIPWHKKIAEAGHKKGKPVVLHSCGNLETLMDDIIDDIKYDGKHSYEDNICPVEEAYEKWSSRIAIMGGLDLDFICRSSKEAVYERAKNMLERSSSRGAYALGSGNSIPEYVPKENYYAMISAATGMTY